MVVGYPILIYNSRFVEAIKERISTFLPGFDAHWEKRKVKLLYKPCFNLRQIETLIHYFKRKSITLAEWNVLDSAQVAAVLPTLCSHRDNGIPRCSSHKLTRGFDVCSAGYLIRFILLMLVG